MGAYLQPFWVWEEVWDLPNTAYLSAWLLIIITVGASLCRLRESNHHGGNCHAIHILVEYGSLMKVAQMHAWFFHAGAMACSFVFERRLWCRHLCPIGGMNGMFAKLSMTELRSA